MLKVLPSETRRIKPGKYRVGGFINYGYSPLTAKMNFLALRYKLYNKKGQL
jgi:hypothetical protein